MSQTALRTLFVLNGFLLAIVDTIAILSSLYWFYWWFDILMHFWGGVLIGMGVHVYYGFKKQDQKPNLTLLLGVLAMMTLSWELFEYVIGSSQPINYVSDTMQDILFGWCGGILSFLVLRFVNIKI